MLYVASSVVTVVGFYLIYRYFKSKDRVVVGCNSMESQYVK